MTWLYPTVKKFGICLAVSTQYRRVCSTDSTDNWKTLQNKLVHLRSDLWF